MEKLEFDSLHKFLVSLGLIFIAIPFVILFFLFNCNITLISQAKYDLLSTYSKNQLKQHEYLLNNIFSFYPLIFGVSILIGVILLFVGIRNWKKVQCNLDALVEADRIKHELDAANMKQSEVLTRAIEEVQESESTTIMPEKSAIVKYMNIEDWYFCNILQAEMKRRYFIKRYVKIGNIEYDGIAISKTDNIDLLYEIKVWKHPMTVQMLSKTLEKLNHAGFNYLAKKNRNFKCILVIVTTPENVNKIQSFVDIFLHEEPNHGYSKFEIQYVANESL